MKKAKIIASVMAMALAITSVLVPADNADAAKKVSITKKLTMNAKTTAKVTIKNAQKKAKVAWKTSNKKVVKISKKSNKAATIKAMKKGTATISAKYKFGKAKAKVLKCKVTVKEAVKVADTTTTSTVTPNNTTALPSASPIADNNVVNPSAVPSNKPEVSPTVEPEKTPKPTRTPKPSPSPTPVPTATPVLVNPHSVDLKTVEVVTDMGKADGVCDIAYNEETSTLDANLDFSAALIKNTAPERVADYSFVKIDYILAGGDMNLYLGGSSLSDNSDDWKGPDAIGWSPEIKFSNFIALGEEEVSLLINAKDYGCEGGYIKALKIFNFGEVATIKIKAITYYMDGSIHEDISKPDDNIKDPEDDVKDPEDDVKDPEDDVNNPDDSNKEPEGDVNNPDDSNKEPEGDGNTTDDSNNV
ncbi:MAG: hypothetical protein E7265_03240 [Lachnospiraceae bacterium]|nr:hypothetical protein [Lachnospiraceae bacterium]